MQTKLSLITAIAFLAIEVNTTEEPYEGKPHARFCEGHALPHIFTLWR